MAECLVGTKDRLRRACRQGGRILGCCFDSLLRRRFEELVPPLRSSVGTWSKGAARTTRGIPRRNPSSLGSLGGVGNGGVGVHTPIPRGSARHESRCGYLPSGSIFLGVGPLGLAVDGRTGTSSHTRTKRMCASTSKGGPEDWGGRLHRAVRRSDAVFWPISDLEQI